MRGSINQDSRYSNAVLGVGVVAVLFLLADAVVLHADTKICNESRISALSFGFDGFELRGLGVLAWLLWDGKAPG